MIYSPKQYFDVYFVKLALNLKSEARKTYLNFAWWVLEPCMFVAVFYVVFEIFLNRGTDNFLVFLLCGKIPFLWFSRTVTNSSNSIMAGRGLISQVAIAKYFFPLVVVGQDFVKQLIVFVFLLIFISSYGMQISWAWFYVIPVLLTQLSLVIACSFVAAAIVPFLPDFKFIINALMMMLMFASGIFYSFEEVILPKHQELFLVNPMANLIVNYRTVLMHNAAPDWVSLTLICLLSLIVILLMVNLYDKINSKFARLVIQ